MPPIRRLYFGDNLDILPAYIADASVDLVYLDPPFNSKRSYNVIFEGPGATPARAQVEAFQDTWTWTPDTQAAFEKLVTSPDVPQAVASALQGFHRLLDESDLMAYLVMMAPRLMEIVRVLKPTGSMFLHCDPTAGHYLKVLLDQVFPRGTFRNEIVWCYRGGGVPKNAFARKHDTIFFYARGKNNNFNPQ